jgi:hypothetical protein
LNFILKVVESIKYFNYKIIISLKKQIDKSVESMKYLNYKIIISLKKQIDKNKIRRFNSYINYFFERALYMYMLFISHIHIFLPVQNSSVVIFGADNLLP